MEKKQTKKQMELAKNKYSAYNARRKHYDPTWVAIGNRLKALRFAHNLSQSQVANAIGKSLSYYKHLEGGFNNPASLPLPAKNALAGVLKTDIEDLF